MFKTTILRILFVGVLSTLSSSAFAAACKTSWVEKVPIIYMCECVSQKALKACEATATTFLIEKNRGCDDGVTPNRMDMHVNRARKYPYISRLRCTKAFGHVKVQPLPPLTPAAVVPYNPPLPEAPTILIPGAPVPCKPGPCEPAGTSKPVYDGIPDSQVSPDRP